MVKTEPVLIGAICPKMDALGNDPCGAHYRDLSRKAAPG